MKLLLKNADLYLPNHYGFGDVLIENGIIKKIAKNISIKADEIIDCTNKIISPMFVDGHEHLLGNYWNEEEIINAGVGTLVACLSNEQSQTCVDNLIKITNKLEKDYKIDCYCLAGSKNYIEDTSKYITNSSRVIGIKTAMFQPQRPKPNLSYKKLKDDAIKTYKAGLNVGKTTQVHIHLDHPFAKGEKVSIEDINSGKLDNLNWIDKIVEETGVPYSLFKLTHAQKYYNRILEYANKGCYIDYTAFHGEYDKRFDCLVESIKNNTVDTSKISISSDLGIMSLEKGETFDTPITLLNTVKKLVFKKGLKLEEALPLITTNALAPIKKTTKLIDDNTVAKLLILNRNLEIVKVILSNNIVKSNDSYNK